MSVTRTGSSYVPSETSEVSAMHRGQTSSGLEQIRRVHIESSGNPLQHIDRSGVFGILEFSEVATIDLGRMRKGFLAEASLPPQLLDIQPNSHTKLHATGRAMMMDISPRDILYNRLLPRCFSQGLNHVLVARNSVKFRQILRFCSEGGGLAYPRIRMIRSVG